MSAGLAALEAQGYDPIAPADRRDGHLAGSAEERARELEDAFADPAVDAVMCVRGGYGSGQLLPLIDLERIAAAGKPLIGMSDITHLQVPLAAAGGGVSVGADAARRTGARASTRPPAFREAVSGEPYSVGAAAAPVGGDRAGRGARAAHGRHDLGPVRDAGDALGARHARAACCCSRTSARSPTASTACSPS